MKQILQSLKNGRTEVADVPCPALRHGHLLVRTHRTLVSSGTERMLLEFGKSGWLDKARQQPDKVRMVLQKMRTDGLLPTIEAVLNKLDQPLPLGYCNVGRVLDKGAEIAGFDLGDRVVSNGKHAQAVCVPVNLCARVPDGVSDESAAFTVLAAIALQGMRLAVPTLGETFVVTGLGLIGLLTVQLLRANGCRVLGIDVDPGRLAMARQFGAQTVDLASGEDPLVAAELFSRGHGVDAVLITASTRSSDPVHQAARMCRKRGRIVLVGVTGLELSRADFYEKELSFQVSCSYGPGRYDPVYEEKGVDYPIGFVRWTEQRNFEAVLDMMQSGAIDVQPLISHRFALDDAESAYELIGGAAPSLGVILEYPDERSESDRSVRVPTVNLPAAASGAGNGVRVGFVGAGNYATAVLIPAFRAAGAKLSAVASANGVSGLHAGRKFGCDRTTTDTAALLHANDIDAVVITTRHDTHAALAVQALASGKHVFVEKPLAMDMAEIEMLEQALAACPSRRLLMVGFNRRFAPLTQRMKGLLDGVRGVPKAFVMTVNAGQIPAAHWTQDTQAGGGRILGEACHFIDLLRHLAGSKVLTWQRLDMRTECQDTASIQLGFEDGSLGVIHYLANGSKSFPKERLEVFAAGRVLQLDNFRVLRGFGWPGFGSQRLWRQDKGQHACAAAFIEAVASGQVEPIPHDELFEVARLTVTIAQAPGGAQGTAHC